MRKITGSFRNSGTYSSPGTPEHGDIISMLETPKGWSSERAAKPNSSCRRHISYAAALLPFNSGRALPSKWDDAERWIKSPISGHESLKAVTADQAPQRQPKSKSGPLGSSGLVRLSNYSPTLRGEIVKNFMGNSMSSGYDAGIGVKSSHLYSESTIARSTSVPGLSNFLGETSGPSSQEVGLDDGTEEEDGVVSRRDMSTQMSREGSVNSSSKRTFLYSILASSSLGPNTNPAAKDEIRDVQVDKSTSTGQQSSKKLGQRNVEEFKNVQVKLLREEAKISAWENLQQAKADAAIQKLEMKLEKKRSVSMDKILNKLKAAQMKAEAMRSSVLSERHDNRTRRISCLGSSCGTFVNFPSLIVREDSS